MLLYGVHMSVENQIFQVVLLTLMVTFICVPLSVWLANRIRLIDYPGSESHKHHQKPTPMAGGIVLILTFLIVSSLFGAWKNQVVLVTFGAGLVVFLFGIWDDFQVISPILKLGGQMLAAIILIRAGIFVQIFESVDFFVNFSTPLARFLNLFITVFWLISLTNAFNFIDSMDGLAVGIGGLVAGFLMLFSFDSGQLELALFSAGLVAVCMGIYFFNSPPALLFLGDNGAQVLGFWLASLAIAYRPPDVSQMSSWFVTILLMGVPIFDLTLVVISRLRRGSPIYLSARDHTYHRLLKIGVNSNRVVLIMHIATVILGCLSIICLYQPPLIANLVFGFVVIFGFVILIYLETRYDGA